MRFKYSFEASSSIEPFGGLPTHEFAFENGTTLCGVIAEPDHYAILVLMRYMERELRPGKAGTADIHRYPVFYSKAPLSPELIELVRDKAAQGSVHEYRPWMSSGDLDNIHGRMSVLTLPKPYKGVPAAMVPAVAFLDADWPEGLSAETLRTDQVRVLKPAAMLPAGILHNLLIPESMADDERLLRAGMM